MDLTRDTTQRFRDRLGLALWRLHGLREDRERKPVVILLAGLVLSAGFLTNEKFDKPTSAHPGLAPSQHLNVAPPPTSRKPLKLEPTTLVPTQSPALKSGIAGILPNVGDFAIAKPFIFNLAGDDRARAVECLATAAWYEAGNDTEGQRSVIQVVLNRVHHPSFPKSVCGVVFQGYERTTGCQFSFTCDGSMRRRFPSTAAWDRAKMLAENALNGAVDTTVRQATHFHADYVAPWWSGKLERLAKIGAHIFYRWPGAQGKLSRPDNGLVENAAFQVPVAMPWQKSQLDSAASSAPKIEADVDVAKLQLPSANPALAAAAAKPTARGIVMEVDPLSPTGRWALQALGKCNGNASCNVIAYGQASETEKNRLLPASSRSRPLFVFVRDKASGMDLALWDCNRIQRPNPAQCLPGEGPELTSLMRDR